MEQRLRTGSLKKKKMFAVFLPARPRNNLPKQTECTVRNVHSVVRWYALHQVSQVRSLQSSITKNLFGMYFPPYTRCDLTIQQMLYYMKQLLDFTNAFSIFNRFYGTRVNVILLTAIRPPLRRFSRNSQILNSIVCRSLIPNFTKIRQ